MPLTNEAKRSSNYSKVKFFKEWHQLRFQVKTLERERSAHVLVRNGEYRKVFSELQEVEAGVERDLKNEENRIQAQLQRLTNKVSSFQNQLKDVKLTPEFLQHLKQNMEAVESAMTEFKEQQQGLFETLLSEQQSVEHDIEIIQKRLQTLSSKESEPTSGRRKAPTSALHNNVSSNLPPEVNAFEKYVEQFGQQGGWDDYDHTAFLKIRNRFKNKKSFIKSAVENIPGYDETDIKEHEAWYATFLELKEAKKVAILQWKIKKEQEQKENCSAVVEEDPVEVEHMRRERAKQEEEERVRKKEQVLKWKQEKAEQLQRKAELKIEEQRRLQHLKDREKQRMDQVREAAKIRLQEKREEKEREMWRHEAEQEEIRTARSEVASREISRFQSRDKLSMNFKLQEKRRKQKEEELKAERLARLKRDVEVHVESDRSRLYQPTDAWLNRKNQKLSEQSSGSANQPIVNNVSHRAVPSWRQGL